MMAIYTSPNSALQARHEITHKSQHNPQQLPPGLDHLRIYYGESTDLESITNPDISLQASLLKVPALEKNFLLSPPGSPPIGWVQGVECGPNPGGHAQAMLEALRGLEDEDEEFRLDGDGDNRDEGDDSRRGSGDSLESQSDRDNSGDGSIDSLNASGGRIAVPRSLDMRNLLRNVTIEGTWGSAHPEVVGAAVVAVADPVGLIRGRGSGGRAGGDDGEVDDRIEVVEGRRRQVLTFGRAPRLVGGARGGRGGQEHDQEEEENEEDDDNDEYNRERDIERQRNRPPPTSTPPPGPPRISDPIDDDGNAWDDVGTGGGVRVHVNDQDQDQDDHHQFELDLPIIVVEQHEGDEDHDENWHPGFGGGRMRMGTGNPPAGTTVPSSYSAGPSIVVGGNSRSSIPQTAMPPLRGSMPIPRTAMPPVSRSSLFGSGR
ncbi:carbohydrate-binding module 1 protein [Blyttiomyces sp. JEL0837]|nr:carbohydrate-binding module 1 protein [Blyttiomyces sp. JEL0837]